MLPREGWGENIYEILTRCVSQHLRINHFCICETPIKACLFSAIIPAITLKFTWKKHVRVAEPGSPSPRSSTPRRWANDAAADSWHCGRRLRTLAQSRTLTSAGVLRRTRQTPGSGTAQTRGTRIGVALCLSMACLRCAGKRDPYLITVFEITFHSSELWRQNP